MTGIERKNIAKVLAIYLPAFHVIPENDRWWGKGFTEWDNVKAGKSMFTGHVQPVHPLNNNYYDLSTTTSIDKQAKLALKYGVDGFMFYHYWFGNGKMLLEKPAELLRDEIKDRIGYCFCWANGTWMTTWHGKDSKEILRQEYPGKKDWDRHLEYLLKFFNDTRYIKVDNKPLMFIYNPSEIPQYSEMVQYFDTRLKDKGFAGMYVVEYISSKNRSLHSESSSAVVEFEPLYTTFFDLSLVKLFKRWLCKKTKTLDFQDYDYLWGKILSRKRTYGDKAIFKGGFVGWDNSPRKGKDSMVVTGASPEKFGYYLRKLIDSDRKNTNNYIVLNAWNEWSEGAFLEPSEEYGYAYLEEVKRAKEDA